jgi:hypothetical protein
MGILTTMQDVDVEVAIANATERHEAHHAEGNTSHCLMLHVGPPKTGSTTIQEETQALRESLRDDGVKVLDSRDLIPVRPASQMRNIVASCFSESCPPGESPHGVRLRTSCEQAHKLLCPNLSETLKRFTEKSRITFLSSEVLGRVSNMSLLASTLQDINTTIIVVYRPYYELFASRYRQRHRSKAKGQSDFNAYATSQQILHEFNMTSSLAAYLKFRTHFRNVKVHALSDDLVPNVICNDLGAVHTCERVRGNASMEMHANVRRTDNFTGRCLDAERVDLLRWLSMKERSFFQNALRDETPEDWERAFQQNFTQSFSTCFGMR